MSVASDITRSGPLKDITTTDWFGPFEDYKKHLEDDYFKNDPPIGPGERLGRQRRFMVEYYPGRKWIRVEIINSGQRSIHSYVVTMAEGKFNLGDILKPASWKAPSKNFSRGNIFYPGTYCNRATWAGVN